MIAAFFARIAEGLVAPRRSVRRMLEAGPRGADVLLGLLLLSYLVQALAVLIVPGARGQTPDNLLTWHLAGFTLQVVMFMVVSALVFGIGRMFGGRADFAQSMVAVAWLSLVSAFLAPVMHWGMTGLTAHPPSTSAVMVFLIVGGYQTWLLACYTAELHGFRNTWLVLGAILGLSALASMVLFSLLPAS